MNQITTLMDFWQFQSGWVLGWVLLPIVVGIGWSTRSRRHGRRSPWGLAGPAWVIGSLMALDGWAGHRTVFDVPGQLLAGLALLVLAGEMAYRTPNPKVFGCILGIPGAVLVGTATDFRGPGWIAPLVIVATIVGGTFAAEVDRRAARLGLGPVLWLVTVFGVYVTVPDTELIRPLVGVALPLAVAGWPLRAARIGPGGVAAGVGLLMWVAGIEGYGRPGSIVGASGALGLLLVEPVGRRFLVRRVTPWARRLSVGGFELGFVAAHMAVVAYATRVAGFADDGGPATMLLVPGLVAGAVVGGWFGLSKRVRPERAWFGPRRTRASARRAHPSAGPSDRRRRRGGGNPPAGSPPPRPPPS